MLGEYCRRRQGEHRQSPPANTHIPPSPASLLAKRKPEDGWENCFLLVLIPINLGLSSLCPSWKLGESPDKTSSSDNGAQSNFYSTLLEGGAP